LKIHIHASNLRTSITKKNLFYVKLIPKKNIVASQNHTLKTHFLHKLNLPTYPFRFQNNGDRVEIFDTIRKKFIALTPEEWVRQHFIQYLINQKSFLPSLIQLEKPLSYNQLDKRSDIVVYNKSAQPIVLVECKSPQINITQDTFDQIALYNFSLKVKYLIVTNGLNHFCCQMDYVTKSYLFIEQIPLFKEL